MEIKAEAKVHVNQCLKKIKKKNNKKMIKILSSTAQNGGDGKVLKLKKITQ